ncbi:MAG: 3-dehydroquinate synthase, partial [Kiritimatiellae bacterium]|nr:3-dehydroquinate synthase [Kiritimatiellia bacterium]
GVPWACPRSTPGRGFHRPCSFLPARSERPGGTSPNLAGFAAATYMRGIRFVQVPTSLLAMVDSSVGGKTGINLAAGKNLAGAFYQPLAVVADLATLATLPAREFAAGLAEVVKYGVALDAPFLAWLEEHTAAIRAREPQALEHLVARCCELKAEVVSQDERESGRRALLNFGHTLGHALEKITGYGRLLHGEGVALGMVYALELSVARCGFSREDVRRVVALLRAFDLPVVPEGDWAWGAVRKAMAVDKKSAGGQVRGVLSQQLGQSDLPVVVPEAELEAAWKRWWAHGIS